MQKIRHHVFWPPFIFLVFITVLDLTLPKVFTDSINASVNFVLENFGWLFNLVGLACVLTCAYIFFAPLGKVRIGGNSAKPLLSFWNWWAISLCTTVVIGIMFWSMAEPLYHLMQPPVSLGITPGSPEAAIFAMSTIYMHWGLTPYAIYTIPALIFAFVYYNMKQPFSISSIGSPLFGPKILARSSTVIDIICLLSLAAGMAASIGTGVLTISGGLQYLFNIHSAAFSWAIIAFFIALAYIISAITGLTNGIKFLSSFNVYAYFLIVAVVFIFGPSIFILNIGTEALGAYFNNFFTHSLFIGSVSGDQWPKSWTIFYWANWLAWAPISGIFLGRISYGHTVKEFIIVNLLTPVVFTFIWMAVFSGSAIFNELNTHNLFNVLNQQGPEAVSYTVLKDLPLSQILIPVWIFIAFISIVAGADSIVSAMSGLSSSGISPESPEPSKRAKILWGGIIAVIAWIMISTSGINGIKAISNLGGFIALFIEIIALVALLRIANNPEKYSLV